MPRIRTSSHAHHPVLCLTCLFECCSAMALLSCRRILLLSSCSSRRQRHLLALNPGSRCSSLIREQSLCTTAAHCPPALRSTPTTSIPSDTHFGTVSPLERLRDGAKPAPGTGTLSSSGGNKQTPTKVPPTPLALSFSELASSEELMSAVNELGISKPTEVHSLEIPAVVAGENVSRTEDKLEALQQVLERSRANGNRVMVFCNSINSCRAVDHQLKESGIKTVNYHGEVPADERVQSFNKFKEDNVEDRSPALVCTDPAARGLDLVVDHVTMFDCPYNLLRPSWRRMTMQELTHTVRRLGLSLGAGRCHRTLVCGGRDLPGTAADVSSGEHSSARVWMLGAGADNHGGCSGCLLYQFEPGQVMLFAAGKRRALEKLWREFFSDPSQWWDHRSDKVNARYPDFKHKKSQGALWLDGKWKPSWVEVELAALAPGSVQSDIFSWNQRVARHVDAGEYEKAIKLFHQMQQEGTIPDRSIFLRLLKACAGLRALDEGRRIHEQIIQVGCESDVYVGSSLVDMYAKCGSIEDARRVFNRMPTRSVVSWNAMIQGYVKCGQGHKALLLFRQMHLEGVEPDNVTFMGVFNACATVGALNAGRRVHDQIIKNGWDLDLFVSNSLIDMYAKCGSIGDARKAFDKMPTRNVISWNTMIQGYSKCGQGFKALELYQQMQQEGVQPVSVTFVAVVNACASVGGLEAGRRVHEQIIQNGCESDVFVGSSLVDMYTKCGSPEDARRVFNKMPTRNEVSWNAMILGYVKCGQGQKALELFKKMQQEGVKPDPVTFLGVLNACASIRALEEGRRVHEQITQRGWESEVFMSHSLVDMYAKCGSMEDSWRVFKKMSTRSVATWNAMILGCVKCGEGQRALDLSRQMQREGMEPDPVTFVGMLNACAGLGALKQGRRVHEQIIESGFEFDIFVANRLIDMYSKCGSTVDARKVFNKMLSRNVVSWNAMILGYANCGQGQKALELSRQMQKEGMKPDPVTFVGMLNACASTRALEEGRQVHEQMMESGCESEAFVGSSLVDMYAKCGSIEDAWRVFNNMSIRSVASWNAMIVGYAKCGEGRRALDLFQKMQQEGLKPDPITFVGVLNACARVGEIEEGRHVHEQIIRNGYESDVSVNNGLIEMYARCESIEDARRTFNEMPRRNVYSWNAMILGYAKCGQEQNAMELSERMQREGDPESFVGMPNEGASAGALEEGKHVLEQIILCGSESDILMESSVVDLYGKCGSIEDARRAFNKMSTDKLVH